MWICEHRKSGKVSIADGFVSIEDSKIVSELSEAQTAKLHLLPRWKWIEDEQAPEAQEAKAESAEEATKEATPKAKKRRGRPRKSQG